MLRLLTGPAYSATSPSRFVGRVNRGLRIPVGIREARTALADHDGAVHLRAVHRAVILIGPRRGERDGVRLAAAAHDRTARKRGRPLGLDAVGDGLIVGPGPRHGAARRHRVGRRVRGAVVAADEHDSPVVPHGHGPDWTATATATATPTPPPSPPRTRGPPRTTPNPH